MQVTCFNCQQPVAAEDVNISAAIASCRKCNKTFHLGNQVRQKPAVGDVSRISVTHSPFGLLIVKRWMSPAAFFLLFFAIGWNAFLVFWYTAAFSDSNAPWIVKVFPIGHVAVGIGIAYHTLCLFFNKTAIAVNHQQIAMKSGPFPTWNGTSNYDSRSIGQIYAREKIHRSKNSQSISYDLIIADKGGNEKVFLNGLKTLEEARKIEQEIEKALRIGDKPMMSEAG